MPHLTYNTRLIFSCQEDKFKLKELLIEYTKVLNQCSILKYNSCPKSNSIKVLHPLFYHPFRNKNKHIPSQIVIKAEQECLASYRSIKSNKQKIDKPIVKKKLSLRLDKRIYSFKNDTFSLISLGTRIKCSYQKYDKLNELMSKHKFCDPLLFVKNQEIWISLTFKVPSQETEIKEKLALGIDLGIRRAFATSEGNIFIDKKFNKEKRMLRYLKRKLQSSGSKSAKKHLLRLRRREQNKNRNQSHILANAILSSSKNKDVNIIVLEDLKGLKKKKHKFQNKNRISQVPFFQLKTYLEYKAPIYNKLVKTVNPSFTSQIDHRTGNQIKEARRGCRYYSRIKGIVYDADVNAAINIGRRSRHPISQGNPLDGQATVNRPHAAGKAISGGKPPALCWW